MTNWGSLSVLVLYSASAVLVTDTPPCCCFFLTGKISLIIFRQQVFSRAHLTQQPVQILIMAAVGSLSIGLLSRNLIIKGHQVFLTSFCPKFWLSYKLWLSIVQQHLVFSSFMPFQSPGWASISTDLGTRPPDNRHSEWQFSHGSFNHALSFGLRPWSKGPNGSFTIPNSTARTEREGVSHTHTHTHSRYLACYSEHVINVSSFVLCVVRSYSKYQQPHTHAAYNHK